MPDPGTDEILGDLFLYTAQMLCEQSQSSLNFEHLAPIITTAPKPGRARRVALVLGPPMMMDLASITVTIDDFSKTSKLEGLRDAAIHTHAGPWTWRR
jgi:hypothetical protein